MRYGLMAVAAALLFAVASPAQNPQAIYPPLPEAFSSFGEAVCDGFVYVYGGHVGKTHQYSTEAVTGKFRRLNLANPSTGWEELPPGPGLQGLALVAHGGKLYRIGGMQPRNKPGDPTDNISVATCTVFDPQSKKWQPMPDLPAGRSSHDATVVGDLLVVVGGWHMHGRGTKSTWHDTSLVLDLSKNTPQWQSIAQPFERRALNVAAFQGKVYVVGGMSSDNAMEKTVDILDPLTKRWSRGPILPGPIRNGFTPAACTCGGKIHVSPLDGKIYRLTEKNDGWEEVGTVAQPRMVHRIVPAKEDLLLVLGGAAPAGNVAKTEAIEPACCGKPLTRPPLHPTQQVYCPVMTSVPIDADSEEVEYRGVKIKVCCWSCARKWRAEPEAYLNPTLLPQLKEMELPRRKIAQVVCPVYPDRVVSSRDPSVEYMGTTIHFFSEAARKTFLAEPEKYADPKALPTLKLQPTSTASVQRLSPGLPGAAETWPGFRGRGDSLTPAKRLPLKWSDTDNLAWKVDLPGYGQSSPVIWKDRVFVTAVTGEMKERLHLLCLALDTGKVLWKKEFPATQKGKNDDYVSRAAPTPVVDGRCVFAMYESGDVFALSHDGELLWSKQLTREFGEFKNRHGLGSSPVLAGDALVLLVAQNEGSYLLALDTASGKTRWKTDHPFQSSWTSPAFVGDSKGGTIVVSSNGTVEGFSVGDGKLVWSVEGLKGNTVASPTPSAGLVIAGSSEKGSQIAVRLGGQGKVTESHVLWRAEEAHTSFSSPLVHAGLVWSVSKTAVAFCADLKSGKTLWSTRLPASCWASPLGVGDRVYYFDIEGTCTVFQAGPKLEKLAENRLSVQGRVYGVAAVDGAILIRSGTALFRVGRPE